MRSRSKNWQRYGRAAGLIAAGVVAGGTLAGTLSANAATTGTTTAGTTASTATPDADQSQPQRPDETLLTGTTKARVEAAVLAKYSGATIVRTETDSDGVYESHIITTAGDHLIVQVNKAFAVTGTDTRGPAGRGVPGSGAPGSSGGA